MYTRTINVTPQLIHSKHVLVSRHTNSSWAEPLYSAFYKAILFFCVLCILWSSKQDILNCIKNFHFKEWISRYNNQWRSDKTSIVHAPHFRCSLKTSMCGIHTIPSWKCAYFHLVLHVSIQIKDHMNVRVLPFSSTRVHANQRLLKDNLLSGGLDA